MLTDQIKQVGIVGTGYALPSQVITSTNLNTCHLGTTAAQMALAEAGLNSLEIDLIIVATVTPAMIFPATACLVQERLGALRAAAFDLEAAGTGFIYALAVGQQFISTGMYQAVLVISAEFSSTIAPEDSSTAANFGAGAVVLQEVPLGYGILANNLGTDGRMLKDVSLELLKRAGLNKEEVDLLVSSQGNTRISLPATLHEANAKGKIKDGDVVVLAGFNDELTWGSSVMRWFKK